MTVESLATNTVDLEANQVNCNIFLGFRLHALPPRSCWWINPEFQPISNTWILKTKT